MTKRTKAKQETIALAKQLGAGLIYGGNFANETFEITCEAPRGKHWAGETVHELITSQFHDDSSEDSLWQDMLNRIREGLVPCNDKCEWHQEF